MFASGPAVSGTTPLPSSVFKPGTLPFSIAMFATGSAIKQAVSGTSVADGHRRSVTGIRNFFACHENGDQFLFSTY